MKNIGLYPGVHIDTAATRTVSQAGAVALVETVRASGLDWGLSQALDRWRKPLARHDPGKIVADVALALAVGGDCLADVAVLRAEPAVFGQVASDPRGVAAGRHPRRRRRPGPESDRLCAGGGPGQGVGNRRGTRPGPRRERG